MRYFSLEQSSELIKWWKLLFLEACCLHALKPVVPAFFSIFKKKLATLLLDRCQYEILELTKSAFKAILFSPQGDSNAKHSPVMKVAVSPPL